MWLWRQLNFVNVTLNVNEKSEHRNFGETVGIDILYHLHGKESLSRNFNFSRSVHVTYEQIAYKPNMIFH